MMELHSPLLSEAIAASVAHPTAHELIACPSVVPLPGQERIVRNAVVQAQRAGLRLPRRITVRWVDRPRGAYICAGATWYRAAGDILVYLDANLFPDELPRTLYHELQHVADFFDQRTFSHAEMETRAVEFSAWMMGWL